MQSNYHFLYVCIKIGSLNQLEKIECTGSCVTSAAFLPLVHERSFRVCVCVWCVYLCVCVCVCVCMCVCVCVVCVCVVFVVVVCLSFALCLLEQWK